MVFTFWEGEMPGYIELCLKTWKFPYTLLNYGNLNDYTNLPVDKLSKFTLPHIADVVRVHVLRDQGGYWLDTDTIMLGDELPTEDMIGFPETRANTIGYLHTEKGSDMYVKWAEFQDKIIKSGIIPRTWDAFGNAFTDNYVKTHSSISMCDVKDCWPETYMVGGNEHRMYKYKKLYFEQNYRLKDFNKTKMLMLHNSWTPEWYKKLSVEEVLKQKCTLSNVLKEANDD